MSSINPFAALIHDEDEHNNQSKPKIPTLSDMIEEIFGFTINIQHMDAKELMYLDLVQKAHTGTEMDIKVLNHALFDRLFMCSSDNDNIVEYTKKNFKNTHACEHRPMIYLYTAYKKMNEFPHLKDEDKAIIKDMILQNVATAMIQPDIYYGQDIVGEMLSVLRDNGPYCELFLLEACKRVIVEECENDEALRSFMDKLIDLIRAETVKTPLVSYDYTMFNVLRVFAYDELLADLFLDFSAPTRINVGSDYANTAFGAILNLSILPKVPSANFEHFLDPLDQASNSRTEGILWTHLDKINQHMHSFLLSLLKCSPKIKHRTLKWLGDCLKNNSYRGKIWNSHAPPELNPANYTNVTDGFMINMCNVMLRMCQPFCSNYKDKRVLKVDPTYCAIPEGKIEERNTHMYDMFPETCFIPVSSNDELEEDRLYADSYNFVTECFFMCHRAIDLGYRVGVDKIVRLNHEMGRLERAYNDALQQGGSPDLVDTIKERMKGELAKYLSLKAQLLDPNLLKMMFDFVSSSAYWLCQVAVHDNFKDSSTYAPLDELPISFPLSEKIPNTLKCIPEFIIENLLSVLIALRRFNPKVFEEQGYEKMEPIFTFILIYMGSQHHMKNPHVRARIAEGLESLLPYHKDEPAGLNTLGGFQREMLFTSHPHKNEIVLNLLDVFVGIEMTGQSVEFEQKFNYRRPMYSVMEYVWEMPAHQKSFLKLAIEAEANMEAVNPPLFLRFANLLMNDAVFLLDEALANMAKLKEMEQAQFNGEWNNLSARERTQNVSYMHHIGMLARFDNILGRDTIIALEKLTSKITNVFTHSTMVDRIAAMLNYFLLNLVGPNKKNFKVKDSKEYHFEPAATVLDICKIYVNLKDSDAFCLAVSQDGRSYSPNLFTLAEDVLVRIGGGTLIGDLKEVAEKVAQKAKEFEANEEAMSEAPEHFLDPIMSTLMTDPVTLPSSKQTVDRTTIARHLLSDQTDPFNRAPLSMDQVIPNVELAEEIRKWVEERKKQ